MIIKFSKTFVKQRNKAPEKIQKILDKKIKMFMDNPRNPLLNLHKLKGVLKDYHSINITGDWRAILKITKNNKIILFMIMGTHSELYK
jgi:addiction module RelE/StbE family toxin